MSDAELRRSAYIPVYTRGRPLECASCRYFVRLSLSSRVMRDVVCQGTQTSTALLHSTGLSRWPYEPHPARRRQLCYIRRQPWSSITHIFNQLISHSTISNCWLNFDLHHPRIHVRKWSNWLNGWSQVFREDQGVQHRITK